MEKSQVGLLVVVVVFNLTRGYVFLTDFFRESGKEREREKHASVACPTCPDGGSNPPPRLRPDRELTLHPFWCTG